MTNLERQRYWRQTERILRSYDKKYFPAFLRVFKRMVDKFIENRYAGEFLDEELVDVYAKMYKEIVIRFGNEQYRTLEKNVSKQFGFNAEWNAFVNEWIATNGFRMVTLVSGNMRNVILKVIEKAITEGVEQGLGQDEVTRLILQRLEELKVSGVSRFIAERIVRTETNRAANLGHMKGAEKYNFQVLKVWVAAKDERTRRFPRDEFSHLALDGQKRELNEPFTQIGMKGTEAVAMQPGDPEAPAGFTINCRCRVVFEPKRDANGRLIPKIG